MSDTPGTAEEISRRDAARRPNPGSEEAIAAGCICPVLDNCRGKRAPRPPDGWFMVVGCPVHAPEEI